MKTRGPYRQRSVRKIADPVLEALDGRCQGIELGHQVPAHAILANQVIDSILHAGQPQGFIANCAGDLADRFGLERIGGQVLQIGLGSGRERELLEVLAPPRRDAVGVLDVLHVQIVNVVEAKSIHAHDQLAVRRGANEKLGMIADGNWSKVTYTL